MTKQNENEQNNSDSIFWVKGEGMNRRHRNIETFQDLIKSGLNYQKIVELAEDYFTHKKIDEYYDIAIRKIKNPTEESIQEKITEIRREKAKNE